MTTRVLIVDKGEAAGRLAARFVDHGCRVRLSGGVSQAEQEMAAGEFDVLVADAAMGAELSPRLKKGGPRLILTSGGGEGTGPEVLHKSLEPKDYLDICASSGGGKKVLFMDEKVDTSCLLTRHLESAGHKVIRGDGAAPDWDAARTGGLDVAFLDAGMGGWSAWLRLAASRAKVVMPAGPCGKHVAARFLRGEVPVVGKALGEADMDGLVSACLDGAARSSCSVLLVDDDAPFRESIADFLRGEGFKVEEAGRASEGLEKLFAGSFDVVFSDYHMPDMSGVQMIERIRQRLPDIKVVLLTGEADLDSAMHAVHLRVHAYLSKPVNPDALLSVLDRALRERRLESQVKDLLQELRSANERLEEFDRMKSRFLFLVAHDIRSPLSGAKGFVDFVLLRNHDLPAKVKEEIGMVSHALDQVNFLVSDLMDLGRMQSGKLKVTPELMDPRRLSSALKDRFSVLAEQERVKLSWDDAEAPERITADPLRLDQVVSNLVGNAVKHAGEASRVSVRFGSRDGGLSVDITDDGPGLEAAALERIFEPFYQGNDPMALKKGLGLGLAIVRELVEAHGGRVWAESEGVGKGCTFRVLLPAQPPAAEPKA